MAIVRKLTLVFACFVATVLIDTSPTSAQGTPAVAGTGIEIPFDMGPRGHILVNVSLNGHEPVPFALDTGAGRTVVNQARLSALGLEERSSTDTVQGAHGQFEMGLTDVGSLSVGGAALGALELGTMDLTNVEGDDMTLFGVLGFDVLSRFDLTLDFVSNTVVLHPLAADPDDCAVCQGEIWAPFDLVGGTHIEIEVSISDQPIAAILDTGSGRTGMNRRAATAIGVELPATVPGGHAAALKVGELKLGSSVLARDVIVGVVDLPVFAALGFADEPAMLLGTGTLAGRRVGISYGLRRLSVE
jgi:predicted aspartyl protease